MSTQQCEYEEAQEWIVVTKNKNKHKGSIKSKEIHGRGHQNILKMESREEYVQKFMISKSFEMNKKMLSQALDKLQAISSSSRFHVECLGLGNFLSNKKSFIQLQFMELIIMPTVKEILGKKQHIDIKQKSERPLFTQQELSVNVYDPAFSEKELKHLIEMDYESVEKYEIKQNKINVFFMPHCERFLYEGVYKMYSEVKDKNATTLIVIGNSIQEYKERCLLIKEKIPDIFIKTQLKEKRLFDYQNALNDTFILV